MRINSKNQFDKSTTNLQTYFSCLIIVFLVFSELSFAQTVSDVFPTRVTRKTVITVIGTGFDETDRDNIDLGTIPITNKTLLSATEMSFEITETGTSNISQTLTIGSISLSSVNDTIEYIAPKTETLSDNADNTVNRITEIFTNYNGFWRSEQWRNSADPDSPTNPYMPNTRHELLGFTVGGITYSTGVDDALLTANGITFVTQNFKAYASAGLSGEITETNHLMLADMLDGIEDGNVENTVNMSAEIKEMKIFDVFVDGVNGLDIGTGATQFNENANIQFFSGDGQVGAASDNIPDLLITQIGATSSSKSDVYYYADVDGNVVGTPIELFIRNQDDNNGPALLARWRIDFYDYRNFEDYEVATPFRRVLSSLKTRRLRMVGFELSDFDINASNISDINNINSASGGDADIAFLAYNAGAFKIKSPNITSNPISRYVCKYPYNTSVSFTVGAEIEGGPTGTPVGTPTADEEIKYQWYRNNTEITGETTDTYSIPIVNESDAGLYKVRVSNKFGTSIVPVRIITGGVPSTWNGVAWVQPSSYSAFTVTDSERNLIFPENYTVSSDLEGCNCTVPAGSQVTVASNATLKLHKEITVDPEEADQFDLVTSQTFPGLPAGQITFEDNASLIQTMATIVNENTGLINMKRVADNLNAFDYVYWSSPVNDFNVSNISNTPTYIWDVNATNANGSEGNWISASGSVMEAGKGYIVRVPSASAFTTEFKGVPNNGEVTINVGKTSNTQAVDDSHWNLVGNPYPSAINALSFLTKNTDLDGNVRIWMHNNAISSTPNPVDNPFYNNFTYNYGDQYVTHNGTGSTPANVFNGNIAAGQGFFVQVLESAPAGPISFDNGMRFDSTENAYDNSEFYRTNSPSTETQIEKQLMWLSLIKENGQSASTLIGYVDGATNQKDRLYDALGESTDLGIYSLISDEEMIIQGRSLPLKATDFVSLGIKTQENGIYTIGINQLEGSDFIDNEQEIYLEDTYLNTIHNLREQPYSFTANAGVTNDRFVVRYTNSTLSIDDVLANNTLVYVKNETLNIKSKNQNIEGVKVYSLTGKQIVDYKIENSHEDFSEPFSFPKSVYLVNITLTDGNITTKKVVN